jgi:hypothetical protein
LQDFGAVGDGVADDSQAFLDAVDAIGREGTILVPEGQYIITKQINIPNRVVIRGERLTACLVLLHASVLYPQAHSKKSCYLLHGSQTHVDVCLAFNKLANIGCRHAPCHNTPGVSQAAE